jgi:hypothetical protein
MIVVTSPCPMCRNKGAVIVEEEGYLAWRDLGWNIQDALPDLSADERELLISGTHAHCWQKMWAGFEEKTDA